MGLVLGIIGLIAAGCLVAYAIALTIKWLRNKISEKLKDKNVKKVAVGDMQKLVDDCENSVSMDELNKLADEGYSHFMVDIDNNGKVVGDVELIKDKNDSLDEDVNKLLGKEKMVIVG